MPKSNPAIEARIAAARLQIDHEAGASDTRETWAAVDEMRPLSMLDTQAAGMVKFMNYDLPFDYAERVRPGYVVIATSFIRATHAEAQLREVMIQIRA